MSNQKLKSTKVKMDPSDEILAQRIIDEMNTMGRTYLQIPKNKIM